jgi:ribonuclease HI
MPVLPSDAVVAYIDGGSRGNPGPAGFGVHVETADGTLVAELREALGVATNNVAEYSGLIGALTWALDNGRRRLHVRSDSLLLVKQMRGEYRVKNPGLQALHRRANELVARFDRVTFEHVPRSQNEDADRLANLAMDEAASEPPAPAHGRPNGENRADAAPDPRGPSPVRATRQCGLPFDDDLPDNAPHSTQSPPTIRRPRRP